MRLGQTPRLEQQQKLIITPELRQAITILQLPLAELEDYIAVEALENPMLELREDIEAPAEQVDSPEPEWLDYFHDVSDLGYLRQRDEQYRPQEDLSAPAPTLTEHLTVQLLLNSPDDAVRRACAFLIDSLDANGYLALTVDEGARLLGLSTETVARALALLQSFEPSGVGARSLAECLELQIAALQQDAPLAISIIRGHLSDLAEGKLTRIASALKADLSDIQAAADLIRTLDPKPGRCFSSGDDPRYIRPDAVVEHVGDDYVVIINDTVSPRLRISSYYRAVLSRGGDEEAQRFLQGKLHSALWLLRSLEQRRQTLYRIVEAIVRYQRPFFAFGIRHLRSLTLHDVALSVGLHESTISRAAANKYVQTPQGCHALKFFFSSGVGQGIGGSYSATSIKQIIRDLVAAEDPRHPLSDERLTELLGERGIPISRRTLAKYRDESGIASSAKRHKGNR